MNNAYYYTAKLTDGTVMDFSGKCNKVVYTDPNYVVFGEMSADMITTSVYYILAIIPHTSIYSIVKVGGE